MTKRELFEGLKIMAMENGRQDYVDGLNHELELLDKKNKTPKGPSARQMENEHIKDYILKNIGTRQFTVTEMIKELNLESKFGEMSVSRITAICSKAKENGEMVRETIKRQAFYKKA